MNSEDAIHDELVVEAPAEQAEKAHEWLVRCMTQGMAQLLKEVPVVVEALVQKSWAHVVEEA